MGTLINDKDQGFLDNIAQEVNCLAGTVARIYQFEEGSSVRDWKYQESKSRTYKKDENGVPGINCPVLKKSPDRSDISGEEGSRLEKHAVVFVARKDLDERDLRRPRKGDIWYIWGTYYDVKFSSATEGRFSDTGVTTEYQVDIVHRTKGPPEAVNMDTIPG